MITDEKSTQMFRQQDLYTPKCSKVLGAKMKTKKFCFLEPFQKSMKQLYYEKDEVIVRNPSGQ